MFPSSAQHMLGSLLRWLLRGGRTRLRFHNEDKENLFVYVPEADRLRVQSQAARLLIEYRLHHFYASSQVDNYRENLFYLDVLERAFDTIPTVLPPVIDAVDIGPSDWFYIQALFAFLKWWQVPSGREINLSGYEIDAHKDYGDGYTRQDHALANIRDLKGVRYLPQRFKSKKHAFDFGAMFFPFLFLEGHLAWGLSRSAFSPLTLLSEVWASLKNSGVLLIVNQGLDEHRSQREMLASIGIIPRASFCHNSMFYEYDIPRYIHIAIRNNSCD
jgi:hypothetical protein